MPYSAETGEYSAPASDWGSSWLPAAGIGAGLIAAYLRSQADDENKRRQEEKSAAQNQLVLALNMGNEAMFQDAYRRAYAPETAQENILARAWRSIAGGPAPEQPIAQVPANYGDYFTRKREDHETQLTESKARRDYEARRLDLEKQRIDADAANRVAESERHKEDRRQRHEEYLAGRQLDLARLDLTKREISERLAAGNLIQVGNYLIDRTTRQVVFRVPRDPVSVFDVATNRMVSVPGPFGGVVPDDSTTLVDLSSGRSRRVKGRVHEINQPTYVRDAATGELAVIPGKFAGEINQPTFVPDPNNPGGYVQIGTSVKVAGSRAPVSGGSFRDRVKQQLLPAETPSADVASPVARRDSTAGITDPTVRRALSEDEAFRTILKKRKGGT